MKYLNLKILREQFSLLCFSLFVVQIWCLYLVNRLLYGVLPETTFLTKTAEHDLNLTSITFDLGWPRVNFFQRMRRMMSGEVLKISKRYSEPNLSYWRKSTRGALWLPPSGGGLRKCNVRVLKMHPIIFAEGAPHSFLFYMYCVKLLLNSVM